ncbi:AAA family ATPase [Streptomyces minutiscleroticus]|uniref:Tunicamycin resistance protein n=1 Tax=Streptomyces minutiscleroticus TaxID=68238 RepID=A0A918KNW6_9ACTN|nr:AAA family ATPase [Streptomyces minutiscleroticus]GGX70313.1 tunicamycin resistance protein [Streptomyces minutiscleroticus]
MIVWVNGAFGSGKTTLVEELRRRRPEALVFDPEQIGYVLREVVDVPTGNFQDLPLWRRQVGSMAAGLVEEYGRTVFTPMTLVRPDYADEIFGMLRAAGITVHHFYLDVPAKTLTRRIDARDLVPGDPARNEAVKAWCKARVAECAVAAKALPEDTVRLDGERPVAELATEVLRRLEA